MELKIPDMTCGGCLRSVKKAIQDVAPGVTVRADVAARTVRVDGPADEWRVRQALAAAGFPAS